MRKISITLILSLSIILACSNGPFREKRDTTLYDRTYLIFLADKVDSRGHERISYQIYKIDSDYNNFASGNSGTRADVIDIGPENETLRKQVFRDFKKKYPDSRIYVNYELYE
jgi:hypothetical protein